MLIIKKPPTPEIKFINTDFVYDVPGEVNRFGVKIIVANGKQEQWIIDGKTGKPAKRDDYECMESNGLYLWVKKGEVFRSIDGLPYPSIWNKGNH